MSAHEVRSLRLDICPDCGGVWFDAGEFGTISTQGSRAVDAVVAEEAPDLKPAPQTAVRHCPVCTTPLNNYHFAGTSAVLLSGCAQCAGIYLAHDDLVRLDQRDRQLEGRDGEKLNPEVATSVGVLDSEIAYNHFRSNLAQYEWNLLRTPVMFT